MKINSFRRLLCGVAVSGSLLLACAPQSKANLSYTITLDVASLIGNANAPFSLDLTLSSGSQFPNSLNTVILSNFTFLNGSVGAVSYSNGGESGSMASTVTLTNSSEANELAQFIGSTVTRISFNVNETSNTNNPYPDQFYVAILDGGLNNIPTTDPSGGNTLVLSNINTAQTLASVATYRSTANGEAPGVIASAVPEPSPVVGLLIGLGGLGLGVHRKTSRRFVRA